MAYVRSLALLGGTILAACTAPQSSALDRLRQQSPVASVDVSAGYQDVAACLSDHLMRRNLHVVPNERPAEGRETVTAFAHRSQRGSSLWLRLEYEVLQTAPTLSRASLRRASPGRDSSEETAELRAIVGRCGFRVV
jgi:hypothetical protein